MTPFVQSAEGPSVENTAPGTGDRGRIETKGREGKARGLERSSRGGLGGKGTKAQGNCVGSEDLPETCICSQHALPLDGAVGQHVQKIALPQSPGSQLPLRGPCISGACLEQSSMEPPN